jgi:predicted Zn-ribbon and HTH transcriptional regulator
MGIKARARERYKQQYLRNMPDLKPHELEKLTNDAESDISDWAAFAKSEIELAQSAPVEEVARELAASLRNGDWQRVRDAVAILRQHGYGAEGQGVGPRCPKCKNHRIEVMYGLYVPDGEVSPHQATCRDCGYGRSSAQNLADFAQFFSPGSPGERNRGGKVNE